MDRDRPIPYTLVIVRSFPLSQATQAHLFERETRTRCGLKTAGLERGPLRNGENLCPRCFPTASERVFVALQAGAR